MCVNSGVNVEWRPLWEGDRRAEPECTKSRSCEHLCICANVVGFGKKALSHGDQREKAGSWDCSWLGDTTKMTVRLEQKTWRVIRLRSGIIRAWGQGMKKIVRKMDFTLNTIGVTLSRRVKWSDLHFKHTTVGAEWNTERFWSKGESSKTSQAIVAVVHKREAGVWTNVVADVRSDWVLNFILICFDCGDKMCWYIWQWVSRWEKGKT